MKGSKTTLYLTQGLLVSGALNICFLALFFFIMVKERPIVSWGRIKPLIYTSITQEIDPTTTEVVWALEDLPFDLLVEKLHDQQYIEDGYRVCDLALGVMVTVHRFDVDRALKGLPKPYEERLLQVPLFDQQKEKELLVYPGLSDVQFAQIIAFAEREKWPLSARGLFEKIEQMGLEETLMASFVQTQEFLLLDQLFVGADKTIKPHQIVHILLDADWEQLRHLLQKQELTRTAFLLEYIAQKSRHAALTLLQTDWNFALKKLDDPTVLMLLGLLEDKEEMEVEYVQEIMASPRSQAVCLVAAEKLHVLDLEETVAPICTQEPLTYRVEEGDSLWKISRNFGLTIEELKGKNNLESDMLRPGMELLL